jgi:amino acid transporter
MLINDKYLDKLPKTIVFITLFFTLIPFVLNLFGIDFSTLLGKGSFTHVILEWSAVVLAIITCVLAYTHYDLKVDPLTPVLGVALLCAGFMDGFHALAAARLIESSSDSNNLVPFT